MTEKLSSRTFEKYSPLTRLTVHNVFISIDENQLKASLEQSYGDVLQITSETDIQYNPIRNWYVILDVPENPDSLPFTRNGYPNLMSLHVFDSLNGSSHTFKVTFYCRNCQKDGHPKKYCTNINNVTSPAELTKSTKTNSSIQKGRKNASKSISLPKIPTDNSVPSRTDSMRAKKRNCGKDTLTEYPRSPKKNKSSCQSINLKNQCKNYDSQIAVNYSSELNFANYSSTRTAPVPSIFSPSGSPGASYSSFTSACLLDMGESSSSDAITKNEVNSTPGKPEAKVFKKEVGGPSSLIESYVEAAGGVLTRANLIAFLAHSKKKSNLQRLLRLYRIDAEGLLKQVNDIFDLYYKNPDQGTKSDKTFVKNLEGLSSKLERIRHE